MNMKKISILGSTGSIGTQSLEVVTENTDKFEVFALSCNSDYEKMLEQIENFKPKYAVINKEEAFEKLLEAVKTKNLDTEILLGMDGLVKVVSAKEVDIVLVSIVGNAALIPTVEAIKAKKRIALANKEVLVTSGKLIMELIKEHEVEIIPVDSEHSAIFQSLEGSKHKEIDKLILTASGGPFVSFDKERLKTVTSKEALKHPNWEMGRKISIDSSTLMNKGLEVIEAKWLFDVDIDDVDVVVHRQSIIHSMVQFVDSSVIAQLGLPDMKLPIQHAFTYPDRIKNDLERMNLAKIGALTFEEPDKERFPCLELAYEAIRKGGTAPTVLNAANEILVERFLNDEIGFYDIPKGIKTLMDSHSPIMDYTIEDIIRVDEEIRGKAYTLIF